MTNSLSFFFTPHRWQQLGMELPPRTFEGITIQNGNKVKYIIPLLKDQFLYTTYNSEGNTVHCYELLSSVHSI